MPKIYLFKPVKRNTFPSPLPFILTEEYFPKNQKMLVFLPHSDDGRYFGCSLHLMNKHNQVKIIIMSPGNYGVEGDMSEEEKTEIRWQEALRWSQLLGFRKDQLIAFRADKTYKTQKMNLAELQRLETFIGNEQPTMVFMPHICDTAQAINYHTRTMVMKALVAYLQPDGKRRNKQPALFVVEYPTNHVPLIPPSDRNCIVVFSDPKMANIKHTANEAHKSQQRSFFYITEKMLEAVQAVAEADKLRYMNRRRQYADSLSAVGVDPRKSRSEHFGVTKIWLDAKKKTIVEERLVFPLSKENKKLWRGAF